MPFKLVREIPCHDLRPAVQNGSGASLLAILRADDEQRVPLWRDVLGGLACAWRHAMRGGR